MVLKEVGEILTFRFVQVLTVTISSNDLFLKLYVFQAILHLTVHTNNLTILP